MAVFTANHLTDTDKQADGQIVTSRRPNAHTVGRALLIMSAVQFIPGDLRSSAAVAWSRDLHFEASLRSPRTSTTQHTTWPNIEQWSFRAGTHGNGAAMVKELAERTRHCSRCYYGE